MATTDHDVQLSLFWCHILTVLSREALEKRYIIPVIQIVVTNMSTRFNHGPIVLIAYFCRDEWDLALHGTCDRTLKKQQSSWQSCFPYESSCLKKYFCVNYQHLIFVFYLKRIGLSKLYTNCGTSMKHSHTMHTASKSQVSPTWSSDCIELADHIDNSLFLKPLNNARITCYGLHWKGAYVTSSIGIVACQKQRI